MLAESGAQLAYFKLGARLPVFDNAPFANQAVLNLALRHVLCKPVLKPLVTYDKLNRIGHGLI